MIGRRFKLSSFHVRTLRPRGCALPTRRQRRCQFPAGKPARRPPPLGKLSGASDRDALRGFEALPVRRSQFDPGLAVPQGHWNVQDQAPAVAGHASGQAGRRIPKSELIVKVRDWAENSVPEPAKVRWPWSRNRVAGMLSGCWPAPEATPHGARAQRSRPRSPRGCWVPHPARDVPPSLVRIRAGCCGWLHDCKPERASRAGRETLPDTAARRLGELLAAGRMRAARAGPSRTHAPPSQRLGSSAESDSRSCYRTPAGRQPAGSWTAGFRPRPGRTPGADSSPPWRARCSCGPAGAGSRSRGC